MLDISYLGLVDDESIQLDAAALELASLDHPAVDLAPYVSILNAMTERLALIGGDAITAQEQARILARVIARENGFGGDDRTYDDPANADLIRVIDRRRGLPVSLSILYVSQARRLGWTADAINSPGHVLVRLGPEVAPALVDPFASGVVLPADPLRSMAEHGPSPAAVPASERLSAMDNRAVLVRLLINQATRAERGGNEARALILYERMTVIAPGFSHPWWERARLERATGDIAAARASLSAMLEITRDPHLRAHVHAALAS